MRPDCTESAQASCPRPSAVYRVRACAVSSVLEVLLQALHTFQHLDHVPMHPHNPPRSPQGKNETNFGDPSSASLLCFSLAIRRARSHARCCVISWQCFGRGPVPAPGSRIRLPAVRVWRLSLSPRCAN